MAFKHRPLPRREEIKLIISDVDGTLLDSHHTLSTSNPNHVVLRRIRSTYPSLPIILSTGKAWSATTSLRNQLDLHPFPACHLNGNVLYCPDGSVFASSGLDLPIALAVYDAMKTAGFSLFIYGRESTYQVLPWKADPDSAVWADKLRGYGEHVVGYDQAEEVMRQVRSGELEVVKMAVCEDEALLSNARRILESWPTPDSFALTQALTFCLEIIPASFNKGTALVRLLDYMNQSLPEPIAVENVISFGDGQNDVSMFKVAGMSVAMGNGMPAAKEVAVWETSTNDEGGLGVFLEKIFFQ